MIKAVYFDYGGVLSPGGLVSISRQVPAEFFRLQPDDIKTQDLDDQCGKGAISLDEFFQKVSDRYGPGQPLLTEEEYVSRADIFQRNEQVYDLAAKLRSKNIVTGIFSNVTNVNSQLLANRGFYDDFTPIVLSCMTSARKPDPAIYHQALKQICTSPEKILVVDDNALNLGPAQLLGMQTLLATMPDQVVADVEAMVFKQNGAL